MVRAKEDQNKLDNSLVFDAGKDGMQIHVRYRILTEKEKLQLQ